MHYMALFKEIKTTLVSNPDIFYPSKLTKSFYDKLKIKCKSKNKEFCVGIDLWFLCKKRDLRQIAKAVEVVRIIIEAQDEKLEGTQEEIRRKNLFPIGCKYVIFNQQLFCNKKYYLDLF